MTAAIPEWQGNLEHANPRPKTSTVENIVLPLDDGKLSQLAIPVARELARLHAATVHVVYLGDQNFPDRDAVTRLGMKPGQVRSVILNQRKGSPSDRVIGASRELPRSLIVMCTHTGKHSEGERFGAITEAVLLTKPDRIVLLTPDRGDSAWRLQTILLAHDGTPACHPAAAPAAEHGDL